ncbi:sterol desaturase family protein [Algoriphagus confluentis]|uniref:Sterol desaturase family protein n=1 Tax=Algoriphagus confluentis TaxID=1697556 RepID=A0ABQ6PR66_9BACT|nr:sterol desaturase family protein [Algoriphagus confluentis]
MIDILAGYWDALVQLVDTGEATTKLLLPFYLSVIFIERLGYFIGHTRYNGKDAFTSLAISAFNTLVVGTLVAGFVFFTVYTWIYDHFRLWEMPYSWWGWVLVFLIHDLFYYTEHRLAHRVGLFWAFHHVHHSSKEFNFTTASRGFFLDGFLTTSWIYYLTPLFGVDILQFTVIVVLTNLFGIFNHTQLVKDLGFLEYVLATPKNHSVHHAKNVKYLDKNYGQVLILWDILFGTFQKEDPKEKPVYGLTKDIDTFNPVKVEVAGVAWLWSQIKSADKWKDKLNYLIQPPGWSHTGDHQRVEDMILEKQQKPLSHALSEV